MKKPNVKTDNKLLLKQVVSVSVSNGTEDGHFSEGASILRDARFNPVGAHPTQQHHVQGTAPSIGNDTFVLLEHASFKSAAYVPATIFLIDRETKTIIDTGQIIYAPEQRDDGHLVFSVNGVAIRFWDIVTQEPSPEIILKESLFQNKRKLSLSYAAPDVLIPLAERMEPSPDPILRLMEQSPRFAEFVANNCPNSKAMSVSAGIAAYIQKKQITMTVFARTLQVPDPNLFYYLLALKHLHPDLQNALANPQRAPNAPAGKELTVTTAASIAKAPLEHQIAIWNEVKVLTSERDILAAVRKKVRALTATPA